MDSGSRRRLLQERLGNKEKRQQRLERIRQSNGSVRAPPMNAARCAPPPVVPPPRVASAAPTPRRWPWLLAIVIAVFVALTLLYISMVVLGASGALGVGILLGLRWSSYKSR